MVGRVIAAGDAGHVGGLHCHGHGAQDVEKHGKVIDRPVHEDAAPGLVGVEEPAAGGLVFDSGPHARVAVDHADERERACLTRVKRHAGGGHGGLGVEADGAVAEFAARLCGGGEHLVEFGEGAGERLFAENVVTGGEGQERHGGVEPGRDGDHGDVLRALGGGEHGLGRVEECGLGEGRGEGGAGLRGGVGGENGGGGQQAGGGGVVVGDGPAPMRRMRMAVTPRWRRRGA